ncbi:magnesium transporter NIPA [Saccharopolyspora erythraea NRRL 2338]|uniref:Integral membrane protein n=2 Tax=Saccharopolyspora erythraea TaxID=1836 RepID=A4FHR4_SACEN|nr:DMT family transporter [Saccharopolyspora erythraea]EQD83110.1 membrane protein [Saccharopolyspora erythraea D]PFG97276.1 magnesium transporter NIPA [Saccharopolyspora erythraea NRRL 2338]QRK87471.1 DMT family transporter [Saccharopolyspora erythraea]CAM03589.1 integral membrane protein [Saccharopolyspora erythraea NRRL 2338]
MDGAHLLVAVPAAVVGAAAFGVASAVQQREAKSTEVTARVSPRLLWLLVRRPAWVASVLAVVAGLSLQMVALAFGPLSLVQPLLLSGLLFGATFAAWGAGKRLDRTLLVGVLCCIGGLSLFLSSARPSESTDHTIGMEALPLGVLLALVLFACALMVVHARTEIRVLALALATGLLYGVTAALLKVIAGEVREAGLLAPFQHWSLYVVCLIGPVGFLLSQNAFREGVFLSPALTVIAVTDPLVGVVAGVSWFGERISTDAAALAGEVTGALAVVAGVFLLVRESETARRDPGRSAGARGG